jgi:hypothetical protein
VSVCGCSLRRVKTERRKRKQEVSLQQLKHQLETLPLGRSSPSLKVWQWAASVLVLGSVQQSVALWPGLSETRSASQTSVLAPEPLVCFGDY